MSAALYFLAPWEVRWPTNQWAIYNRFAIVTAMLSVLMIDVPFPQHLWRHRRWPALYILGFWMIPVTLFSARNEAVYADFNERNAFVLEAVQDLLQIGASCRSCGTPATLPRISELLINSTPTM